MIKWLSFWKSLKQLFIIWLISCFILLGNSFASAWYTWSFYNVDSVYPVWTTAFSFRPISSSTTILEWWWMTDPKAIIYVHNQVNSNRWDSLYFWGADSTLYSVENPNYKSSDMVSYKANNFCKINWTDFTTKTRWNLCSDAQIVSSGSVYNDSSLKWEMTQIAMLEYDSFSQSANDNAICFVYWNLGFSLCYYNSKTSPTYMSVSASIPWASLDPVAFNKDIIWTSPWVSWNVGWNSNNPIWNPDFEDWYNYSPIDTWDIVFYFENAPQYKFDENVCYVWLDSSNFDILYNTWNDIAFMRWNDYWNIFDLFSYFFWNTFTIKNVGSFIDAWDLNYDEYYNYAERWFNSYYSLSSWYYQVFWENLENPFIWNSLGLFFMSFNVNKYWSYNTIWEQIATYCYYKLWLDENSGWYNITDNSDSSFWNNAWAFIDNRNRSTVYFSGSDSIVSQSWSGSVMDYFTWDDDLDFANFFWKSFNMFKDKFTLNPNDLWVWFLPSYIWLFLMALIIFRFLSH